MLMNWINLRTAAGLALLSVVIALVSQHWLDMQPCAWCTFQRLIYLGFAAVALAAWSLRRTTAGRLLALLAAMVAAGGLAAALWQQFVASQSQSCAMTLADKAIKGPGLDQLMPWLFKATAFCDEANIPLLGVPYAIWSAALFALLLVIAAWSARTPPNPMANAS